MQIPFSLPLIDADVVAEVHDCLTNTGWVTSGPKVQALEGEIGKLTHTPVVCVNSWTSGAMLMLRWFGVGPGDEVIVPAYTYCATALCAMNLGAKVVMVDVAPDFNLDVARIEAAITPRTKAIIPVDVGGWPCDYQAINALVEEPQIKARFQPSCRRQEQLGRTLVIADAAHSLGATYHGRLSGQLTDVTVFSFHSVKNVTTGEGGAICLNLPAPFDNLAESTFVRSFALNGQTKSAFEKNQPGAWRYDIVDQGLKANMPDICAAVGLAQIRKYMRSLLPERERMCRHYDAAFAGDPRFVVRSMDGEAKSSSYHLYMLRVAGASEHQRDEIINRMAEQGVGANVHYIPMAMLSLFRDRGYDIAEYPMTYDLYRNEISLPVYNGLSHDRIARVISAVKMACDVVMGRP